MSLLRAIKNLGYGDIENLVREATSNSKRDTPRDVLDEIARLTYTRAEFEQLMPMLDRRLNDRTRQWRHVYKSLQLAHYLLLAGSPAAVQYFRDNVYLVKTLREFQYIDSSGADQGQLVRDKAREVTSLLQSPDKLDEARARFRGQKPRRRSSGSSSFAPRAPAPVASRDDDIDTADAARRRRENEAAERARRAEDDALARALEASRQSAEAEAQALAARRAAAEAERKRQAEEDARAMAEKQAADALQAQQLEMARWQLDQSRMNSMYSAGMMYPQYTGMYMQPQMTSAMGYQMPMATGWAQAMPMQQAPTDSFVAGSNNPFAPTTAAVAHAEEVPPPSRTPSLSRTRDAPSRSQSSADVRVATPPNTQPARQVRTKPGSAAYMDQLDTLLASGDGIDTFGNGGNQRLGHYASNRIDLFTQAQHQASPFA